MRMWVMAALLLAGCAVPPPGAVGNASVEVIGALVDRSGPLGAVGANVEAGVALAVEDVNAALAARGAGFRVAMQVEDVGTSPRQAYERLRARGVRAAVGPISSSAASDLAKGATADGLVLISPTSTAPSLAKDDNLLRFAPVDVLQGVAIARAMGERSVQAELVLARDDLYGRDLAQEVEYAVGGQGITHLGTLTYAADATSFDGPLAALDAQVQLATTRFGADGVAVELVSYHEADAIFRAAATYPALGRVRWFGCDGNARAESVRVDPTAAAFARQVRFLASTFVTPREAGLASSVEPGLASPEALASRLQARLGRTAGLEANTAYDALWCLALTREAVGTLADAARVKEALLARNPAFQGTAGPLALDPMGDRMTAVYGFYGIEGDAWKLEALFGNATYTREN
jgi:branched-chain amino acid transport system substrate-binding protein